MTMAWIGVGVGLLGAGASVYGANKQAKGQQNAANINTDMFRTINAQQQPFIQSGYGALSKLNTLLGLNPNPAIPRMSTPLTMPGAMPSAPAWRPTPEGGVVPILQPAPAGPDVHLTDPINPDDGRTALSRILTLRAMHGDTQAANILSKMGALQ